MIVEKVKLVIAKELCLFLCIPGKTSRKFDYSMEVFKEKQKIITS